MFCGAEGDGTSYNREAWTWLLPSSICCYCGKDNVGSVLSSINFLVSNLSLLSSYSADCLYSSLVSGYSSTWGAFLLPHNFNPKGFVICFFCIMFNHYT